MQISEAEAYQSVFHALNKSSGLKAMAGTSIMQDIRNKAMAGNPITEAALSVYVYRAAKYIGAYWATLPDADAIVFTAGVGENEGYVRAKILSFLENLHFEIDAESNAQRKCEMEIARSNVNPKHPLSVLVIPTDEEIVIGYDTLFIGHLKQGVPAVYPFEM